MSTTEPSGPRAVAPTERAHPSDAPLDAEAAARRALGVAINSGSTGDRMSTLPPLPPRLVVEAQALMRARVPAGRERELAIDLLERSARRAGRR